MLSRPRTERAIRNYCLMFVVEINCLFVELNPDGIGLGTLIAGLWRHVPGWTNALIQWPTGPVKTRGTNETGDTALALRCDWVTLLD